MRIDDKVLEELQETLDVSIVERTNESCLLMYDPAKDLVQGLIDARFLEENGLVSDEKLRKEYDPDLVEKIKRFNSGELNEFDLHGIQVGGRQLWRSSERKNIIPFHTNPHEGQEIYPSPYDFNMISEWRAPAVVVGSKDAKDVYRMVVPMVAGYSSGRMNYSNKDVTFLKPSYEAALGIGEHKTLHPLKPVSVSIGSDVLPVRL